MKKNVFGCMIVVAGLLWAGQTMAGTPITLSKGTKAGVYVAYGGLQSSGNYIDNACLEYDGNGGWTAVKPLVWKDRENSAEFYVYAPYVATALDAKAVPFSVATDQSTEEAQAASDFLWGEPQDVRPGSMPQLTLRHKLTRVVVRLVPGDGFTEAELTGGNLSVRLKDIRCEGYFRLDDGSMRLKSEVSTITTRQEEPLCFSAIVIPQEEGAALVSVVWKNTEYPFSLGTRFEGGRQYTLTATMNKTAGGINIGIDDWEEDDEDYGGTVN